MSHPSRHPSPAVPETLDADGIDPIGDEEDVEYRDIEAYPGYRVGEDGSVWTAWTRQGNSGDGRCRIGSRWRALVQVPKGSHPYRFVTLCRDGKRSSFAVHRLILTAFRGSCPEGMEACHGDGNPANNRAENLRWDTRKNNHADKRAHGTHIFGGRHGNAVLTEDQVRQVFVLYKEGLTHREIGELYAVTGYAIQKILTGKTWSFLGLTPPSPVEMSS